MVIHPPDYRLRVFISSTLKELADERNAVRQAVRTLRLTPIMFESGARPHPPKDLYHSYLTHSHIFIGIYWQSYGWIAPESSISGLEDEYILSSKIPRLIYIKNPSPEREPALVTLLDRIQHDNTSSYTYFSTPAQLKELVQNDLALLLTERFELVHVAERASSESPPRYHTNLPIPRNPLIGREIILSTACNLLQRDDIAEITLTGAGGTGKSRLAIQIGLEMLDHFSDGVYMVKLEPIRDPDLVISTIAETLGIRESPGSPPTSELLQDYLHDKHMLLLLDNFEQVVDAAPQVAELLESSPRIKCLVTSRTPLRLRAEKVLPVQPLKVPPIEEFTKQSNLSQYAAVELFIQRAQAIKPDFTVTNTNAPAIAEICYRLDGLPLAIELAAARIKLFAPIGLLDRLQNRFELLRSGTRDLPERQRTLRSTIDWSYELLNEQEKKLFSRLSIFIGSWTLEAAQNICDINGDLIQYLEDALIALIDDNLVIRLQDNEEQPRFGMLNTIQEYAFERLNDSNEVDIIHCHHAAYYLDFVTKAEPLVRSAQRCRWREAMLAEFGNIRGVLAWIQQTRNCIKEGQQIVINLKMFWQFSGYIAEGRQWCDQMLSLCDDSTAIAIRAGLLGVVGEVAWTQGDFSYAITSLVESLDLCYRLGDKHLLAFSLLVRGMVASTIRDIPTAISMLEKSVELYFTVDEPWFEALALSWLGVTALFQNDLEQAMSLCSKSIELARRQGDPWCMMPSLMTFGQMAILAGDIAKARSYYQEAVDLLRQTGDHWSISWALNNLSHVTLMQNELELARQNFRESLTMAHVMGNLGVIVLSLVGIAALIARWITDLHDTQPTGNSEFTLAAHLCGATVPLITNPGVFAWADSKILYDTAIKQAHSLISDNLWNQAFSEGQRIPLDHVIDLALKEIEEL